MKFKPYHKIRQFKDVIKDITNKANYKGKDKNGDSIYEESVKPILKFNGSIKLHGTNAMVYYTPKKGIMAGKRSSGLSPEHLTAHFGFNQFVQITKKIYFIKLMAEIWVTFCKKEEEQIILYGEWAGKGIQSGVGISELNKAFYIFDLKIYNPITDKHRWIDIKNIDVSDESNIYNIADFPTYEIEIDFNNPELVQNKLIELTEAVEYDCPITRQLVGKDKFNEETIVPEKIIKFQNKYGEWEEEVIPEKKYKLIGEGIVWKTEWKGERFIFKVKGDKHSSNKTKNKASVDPEILKNIQEFVSYACTENRVLQAMQETNATEKKDMPNLLRWIANDIITEEDDVLQANNLEWKQVVKEINNRVRLIFFLEIDKL